MTEKVTALHQEASLGLMSEDELLLAYVRERDTRCPLCGYNVRNLTAPRCPECGKALRLSVGLADPFLKAWIALSAAACLSAGIGVFILVVLATGEPLPRFRSLLGAASFYSFVAMIPVAAFALIARRSFLRLNRQTQIMIAVLVAGFVVLQFTGITTWM